MTLLARGCGLVVVLSCCFASCTSQTKIEGRDVSLPSPGVAQDRGPVAADLPAPPSGWKLYEKNAIGQPCPPSEPHTYSQGQASLGRRDEPVCGTKNRVSMEIVRQAAWGPLNAPCEPHNLDPASAHGYARAFCTVGDELVVSTACYMCRLSNVGEVAHARLSELTPEQNAMLAELAGLAAAPRNADEWRELSARAVAVAKQQPVPVGVAAP